ncbi:VOC family protein [Pseudodonghicola flavimaris]|uniref:VOC family protein n=1 Tax=Pseudodonghicola flavimaris TaxID=3050036 RepID=A0ABT7EXA2_9RHOB|nr:VOC family protein [Pseudodonghicola flavimaris]MDK3016975.1 VOC family protein [Pseudodonghicola flavimaris]
MTSHLEHANFTVSDPDATAAWLCEVFGWEIRWAGPAISGGYTVHVGTPAGYLALYRPANPLQPGDDSYTRLGGLNHVGVVVEDLDTTEARVKAAGFLPHNHADYEPGRRFYFDDGDGIEFEVVAYDD